MSSRYSIKALGRKGDHGVTPQEFGVVAYEMDFMRDELRALLAKCCMHGGMLAPCATADVSAEDVDVAERAYDDVSLSDNEINDQLSNPVQW